MAVSILSLIIGGLLLLTSSLIVVGAYLERSRSLCQPECTDIWQVAVLASFGLVGTAVSLSIPALRKSFSLRARVSVWAGGGSFVVVSALAAFLVAPIPVTFVFLLLSLMMMVLIAWVSDWPFHTAR